MFKTLKEKIFPITPSEVIWDADQANPNTPEGIKFGPFRIDSFRRNEGRLEETKVLPAPQAAKPAAAKTLGNFLSQLPTIASYTALKQPAKESSPENFKNYVLEILNFTPEFMASLAQFSPQFAINPALKYLHHGKPEALAYLRDQGMKKGAEWLRSEVESTMFEAFESYSGRQSEKQKKNGPAVKLVDEDAGIPILSRSAADMETIFQFAEHRFFAAFATGTILHRLGIKAVGDIEKLGLVNQLFELHGLYHKTTDLVARDATILHISSSLSSNELAALIEFYSSDAE